MSEAPIRLVHTQNAIAQGLGHARVVASESGQIVVPVTGLTTVYNARGVQFQPGDNTDVTLELTLSWTHEFGVDNGVVDSADVVWHDLGQLTAGEIYVTNKLFTFARLTFEGAGQVDIVG